MTSESVPGDGQQLPQEIDCLAELLFLQRFGGAAELLPQVAGSRQKDVGRLLARPTPSLDDLPRHARLT